MAREATNEEVPTEDVTPAASVNDPDGARASSTGAPTAQRITFLVGYGGHYLDLNLDSEAGRVTSLNNSDQIGDYALTSGVVVWDVRSCD